MEENKIYEELKGLYRSILKKDHIELYPETTAADIDGWDSLTHMILMDSVEKHFAIKFKLMEIMKFNNVGDMVACILKKLVAK
jgi:acyl carrier protein